MHLLCALWHHEILFQDVENLRAIENIELLERQKFGPDKPVSDKLFCQSPRRQLTSRLTELLNMQKLGRGSLRQV